MSTSSHDTLWLTQAAYERLKAELDELTARPGEASPQTEARILELKSIEGDEERARRTEELRASMLEFMDRPTINAGVAPRWATSPTTAWWSPA